MKKYDKFDKIVKLFLGWIGNTLSMFTCILQYIIGLVWVIYCVIRDKNYKENFAYLNKRAKQEFKFGFNEYKRYLKGE